MWIQSHQEIADHPKTKRVMRLLGISRPTTIGYLHLLWWWAVDHADNGDLGRYNAEDIEDAVGWDGKPGAFVDALRKAGYLDGSINDGLWIHDWHEYGGRLEKKNRQAAQRMRNMRARNGDVTRNVRVTSANVTPLDVEVEKEVSVLDVREDSVGGEAPATPEATTPPTFSVLNATPAKAMAEEVEARCVRKYQDATSDTIYHNQTAREWLMRLVNRYGEERAMNGALEYARTNRAKHGGPLKAMEHYLRQPPVTQESAALIALSPVISEWEG